MKKIVDRQDDLERRLTAIENALSKHGLTSEQQYMTRAKFQSEVEIVDSTLTSKFQSHTDQFFARLKTELDSKVTLREFHEKIEQCANAERVDSQVNMLKQRISRCSEESSLEILRECEKVIDMAKQRPTYAEVNREL
jgi:hypothetical protein